MVPIWAGFVSSASSLTLHVPGVAKGAQLAPRSGGECSICGGRGGGIAFGVAAR